MAQKILSRQKHNMLSLLHAACLKLLVFFLPFYRTLAYINHPKALARNKGYLYKDFICWASVRCTQCTRQNKPSLPADDGNAWRCYSEATEVSPKDSDSVSAECSVYLPTVKLCSIHLWSVSSRTKRLSLPKFITVSVSMYRMNTRLRRNIGKYFGMGGCKVKGSVMGFPCKYVSVTEWQRRKGKWLEYKVSEVNSVQNPTKNIWLNDGVY